MPLSVQQWRRGPRTSFSLGKEHGVYALFLRDASQLPDINCGEQGLIYIGLAANQDGLRGRCHFSASTRNHSPRKSLAVLLRTKLALVPIFIPKANSPATWGLNASSEHRLSDWMHANLDLAVELCDQPCLRETELVRHHAPPLNLTKCFQSAGHHQISDMRAEVMALLQQGVGDNR